MHNAKAKTVAEAAAVAAFGFVTSALVIGAVIILVAASVGVKAQDSIFYPTSRDGTATNPGGNLPTQNSWGSRDGNPSGQYWGARANQNSAVFGGVPSTQPTAPANTLGVRK